MLQKDSRTIQLFITMTWGFLEASSCLHQETRLLSNIRFANPQTYWVGISPWSFMACNTFQGGPTDGCWITRSRARLHRLVLPANAKSHGCLNSLKENEIYAGCLYPPSTAHDWNRATASLIQKWVPTKHFVPVGQRDGTPTIALPLANDDGQRRYRLGKITLHRYRTELKNQIP